MLPEMVLVRGDDSPRDSFLRARSTATGLIMTLEVPPGCPVVRSFEVLIYYFLGDSFTEILSRI
jgi:hypothetical protein